MFRRVWLGSFLIFLILLLVPKEFSAATPNIPNIKVLNVDGIIVPIVADYINRGLELAETRRSTAVIIQLNTPGGLLDSTKEIVERILNARVPVVVYVPVGGSADSAGAFITLASHIAAMAPGSRIGAASPVAIDEGEVPDERQRKIIEAAAAWMRSIAEERGRDPHHAELMVTEAKSYTDGEALELNLIDLRADGLQNLISQLNGMKVTLITGEEIVLNTEGYILDEIEMNFVERFLHAISHPNIASILLSIGMIGIMVEIFSPGTLFPGITGVICLLLAFYSLGVLDAYWGGILLVLLAFGLFIAEAFTPTFGLLAAGGVVALVLGFLILFPEEAAFQVNPWLIATIVICITAFFVFLVLVNRITKTQRSAGREELVGKTATVKETLKPEGVVFIRGELWGAISEENQKIEAEEEVIITKTEGLKLWVKRKD